MRPDGGETSPAPIAHREIDDRGAAAILAYEALIEIRLLSGGGFSQRTGIPAEEILVRIRFLANLCHEMPLIARAPAVGRWRMRGRSERERAMCKRPMAWTWGTTGPEGRKWMLKAIEEHGCRWTPPPPLPMAGGSSQQT